MQQSMTQAPDEAFARAALDSAKLMGEFLGTSRAGGSSAESLAALARSLQATQDAAAELAEEPALLDSQAGAPSRRRTRVVSTRLIEYLRDFDSRAGTTLDEVAVRERVRGLTAVVQELSTKAAASESAVDNGSTGAWPAPQATSSTDFVVMLVHGIRTRAEWIERARRLIERHPGFKAIPIRCGYVDTLTFLTYPLRLLPVRTTQKNILYVRKRYPDASLSIVAHSFGCYAVARVLRKEKPLLSIDRLLLCGSVLPLDFDWGELDNVGSISNECGGGDIWPVLAEAFGFGYGASGRYGFHHPKPENRFLPHKHSDYFSREHIRQYWLPFLYFGEHVVAPYEEIRERAALWEAWATNPVVKFALRMVPYGVILAGIVVLASFV